MGCKIETTDPAHYLSLAPGVRLCLGCGERFRDDDAHDYTACHEAFIAATAASWPPLRTMPPV